LEFPLTLAYHYAAPTKKACRMKNRSLSVIKNALILAITALAFIFPYHTTAQPVTSYHFTCFTAEADYPDLTNDTALGDSCMWGQLLISCPAWPVPLGFHFSFFNDTSDTLFITTDEAWYCLHSGPADPSGFDSTRYNIFSPVNISVPLRDRGWFPLYHGTGRPPAIHSLSPVSYKVEGVTPYRIAKVQFKNAGFQNDTTDSAYFNYQVWLYEDSNAIEFHYGPQNVAPVTGADTQVYSSLGLCNQCSGDNSGLIQREFFIVGPTASPSLLYCRPDTLTGMDLEALYGIPPYRMVYRFTPYIDTSHPSGITPLHPTAQNTITVTPNPATDHITITHKGIADGDVFLFDVTGRLVWQRPLPAFGTSDVSTLAPGLYIIKVVSPGNDVFITKLVKQ